MTVQIARQVGPGKIDIAWESFGADGDPPVLLIMGLAAQMLGWHEEFCGELTRRGLRVIRFDNRDVGLSAHLVGASMGGQITRSQPSGSSARQIFRWTRTKCGIGVRWPLTAGMTWTG